MITATATVPNSRTRRRYRSSRGEGLTAMLMAAPAVVGLIAFVAAPFALAIWLSLQNVHLGSDRPPQFFGLEQYRRILIDPRFTGEFRRALTNNAIFAVVVVPAQTAFALALALLLNRPMRGMPIFRTFVFMPVGFP